MSLRRRTPRPLGISLSQLQTRITPETVLAEVQRHWPELVGTIIAAEARPVSERAGVLTVSCSAAVWAAELDGDSQLILERLNAHLSSGRITRLRCVVGAA